MQMIVSALMPKIVSWLKCSRFWKMLLNEIISVVIPCFTMIVYIIAIPKRKRQSPTAHDIHAFFPAAAASGLCHQNPINRYEQTPTISQKMKSWSRLFASTSPNMLPVKSAVSAK